MWSILRVSILSLYVVPLILKTVEMTILQISDTHNRHQLLTDLPTADVLVHCGDFTDMGTEQEVLDFLNWFLESPYPYKLLSQATTTFAYGMPKISKICPKTFIFCKTEVVRLVM